ncbi:MAG: hypothetical protein EOP45_02470 [Sphingobacteriaceae bacterium]|nr:MAG: hypothetical protein EOP45_02470 [Sphingobacteriaceae bacterium]
MLIQKLFILFLLPLTIVSCSPNKSGKKESNINKAHILTFPVKPLFVDNGKDEGWGADIRLTITNIDTINDTIIYKAQSTYESKTVGLEIKRSNSNQNNLILKSCGIMSDNLLITLSQLYKTKIRTTGQFVKSYKVSCIDLHSFAKKNLGISDTLRQMEPKEFKLFFQGQKEKDYAELYLNINSSEHWLELREKDPDYRPLIISFLTKQ